MSGAEQIISGGQLAMLALQLVVLACQAWFLYGTLNATRSSADAATVSAKATRVAADAAKRSAEIAEKSVDNIERPYVLVESVDPQITEFMGGSPSPSEPPHLIVTLKNYGRSPALVLEVRGSLQMIAPGADSFSVPVIPLDNVTVIGPHETWQHTVHYMNTVEDGVRSQIEREIFYFWFLVGVRYEDMLGKEHQTQMRFRYTMRHNKFSIMPADSYTVRI